MAVCFDQVHVRAALFAAPDTLVSTDEVAAIMGVSKQWVHEMRPETAAPLAEGRRTIYATWREWMTALGGYRELEEPDAASGDHPRQRRQADAPNRPPAPRRPVVLAGTTAEALTEDDLVGLGYRPGGGARRG